MVEVSGHGTMTGNTRGAKRNLTQIFMNTKRVGRYQDACNKQKLLKQQAVEKRKKELNDKWLSGKSALQYTVTKPGEIQSNQTTQESTKVEEEDEGEGIEYNASLELPEWTIRQD